MIKIDPFLLIIFAEVVVGLIVILGVITAVFIKRKNKDKALLKLLNERLKDDPDKRQSVLEESIAKSCGDDETNEVATAENKEIAKKMAETEGAFYSRLVTMYTQRDSNALKSLDKLLHEYTSSHLASVSQMRERIDAEQADISEELGTQMERLEQNGQALASEVEKLKNENKSLSGELEKAHAEVEMAMQEYARMAVKGSSGSQSTAVAVAVPLLIEKNVQTDVAIESRTAAELEADLGALDKTESDGDIIRSESGLVTELNTEIATDFESTDELDVEETDVLVDMSMLDDFGEESGGDESAEVVANELVSTDVEAVAEEIVEVELEAVDIPGEVIETVGPEVVKTPDEIVDEIEFGAIDIPDEVIDKIEPESVDNSVKVAGTMTPEEESLEDLVLHAMAEENAAKQVESVVSETPGSMVIDLAKDDDIVLSDSNKISDEPGSILERALEAADNNGIDEDNLLAQLTEIENNDDSNALPGSDKDNKSAG